MHLVFLYFACSIALIIEEGQEEEKAAGLCSHHECEFL